MPESGYNSISTDDMVSVKDKIGQISNAFGSIISLVLYGMPSFTSSSEDHHTFSIVL